MRLSKLIKPLLVCGLVLGVVVWFASARSSQAVASSDIDPKAIRATPQGSEYVGSEACKDCHEDQFKAFSHTSHAQLTKIGSWKEKVTGCE